MIANITQGSFLNGLLEYNNKKVEEEEATLFHTNIMNPSNKNIKRIFHKLIENSKRKDKVFHISLNFLKKDYEHLGEKKLKLLTDDYLKELGFPENHPFLSYMHFDKKHPHIHIVTSKILENNKVLNDKFIFRKSYRISRKLEEKYGITNINEHYKINNENFKNVERINKAKQLKLYKNKKIPLNYLFNSFAMDMLRHDKPVSLIEYQDRLLDYNINLEQTNFKNKGLLYRFEDDTSGIKSSNLEKALSLKELEKTFIINKKQQKKTAEYVAKQIDNLFYKYDKLTYQTFIEELSKKNINVTANITNDTLRGFRFSSNGFSLKGQQLPKRNYTMAKIQHKFGETNTTNEVYWAKYKLKFNQEKINNNSFLDYIKSSMKVGLIPQLTSNGIYLRRANDYLLNLPIKDKMFLNQTFILDIKKLSPKQIENFNQLIKEQLLEENKQIKIDHKIDDDKNLLNDTINEFIDILQGEEYTEEHDDTILSKRKKKKKKKRL